MSIKITKAEMLRVALLAMAIGALNMDFILVGPLLPKIFPPDQISTGGFLITFHTLMGGITVLIIGPFSDRFGRKVFILLGLFLVCVSDLIFPFTQSYTQMAVCRLFAGAGDAMLLANVIAYAGDTFSYERVGGVMGVLTAAQAVAVAVVVYPGMALAERVNWHWTFWMVSILSFLIFVIVIFILPAHPKLAAAADTAGSEPPTQTGDASKGLFGDYFSSFRRALQIPGVLTAAIFCSLLWNGSFHGLFQFTTAFFMKHFDLSVESSGLIMLGVCGIYVMGAVVGGKVSDLWTKKKVWLTTIVACAVLIMLYSSFTPFLWLSVALILTWGSFFGAGDASSYSLMAGLDDKTRGTIISISSACLYFGISMFSAMTSFALKQTGDYMVLGMIGATGFVLMIPLLLSLKGRH